MPAGAMIVTGASRGIGAATARLAAERGYAVAVNYRGDRKGAEAVVAEIAAAGGKALAIAADVAREADVARLFDEAQAELGYVAALVNNAGILERQTRLDDMDAARFERVFAVNVVGPFLCAREAVRRMSTRHGGKGGGIVNVSSAASRLGSPGEYVDYAASKGAIDTFTIGLAKEVAEEGIRVNAVRPGVIYTGIHAAGGEPGRVDRVKGAVPMKRGGEAIEVARAILWLLSDESSYSTGTFIDVSGGRCERGVGRIRYATARARKAPAGTKRRRARPMAMSALFYILGLIVVVTGLASIATLVGVAQLYVTGAAVLALAIGVMLAITRSRGSVA